VIHVAHVLHVARIQSNKQLHGVSNGATRSRDHRTTNHRRHLSIHHLSIYPSIHPSNPWRTSNYGLLSIRQRHSHLYASCFHISFGRGGVCDGGLMKADSIELIQDTKARVGTSRRHLMYSIAERMWLPNDYANGEQLIWVPYGVLKELLNSGVDWYTQSRLWVRWEPSAPYDKGALSPLTPFGSLALSHS